MRRECPLSLPAPHIVPHRLRVVAGAAEGLKVRPVVGSAVPLADHMMHDGGHSSAPRAQRMLGEETSPELPPLRAVSLSRRRRSPSAPSAHHLAPVRLAVPIWAPGQAGASWPPTGAARSTWHTFSQLLPPQGGAHTRHRAGQKGHAAPGRAARWYSASAPRPRARRGHRLPSIPQSQPQIAYTAKSHCPSVPSRPRL